MAAEPDPASDGSEDEEERMLKERLRQLKENKKRARELARHGGVQEKALKRDYQLLDRLERRRK